MSQRHHPVILGNAASHSLDESITCFCETVVSCLANTKCMRVRHKTSNLQMLNLNVAGFFLWLNMQKYTICTHREDRRGSCAVARGLLIAGQYKYKVLRVGKRAQLEGG